MRARITTDLLGLAADEAEGFARAKPRRSTTKTAYRVEGTTTSSAQKTKSRRDRVFFRRVAEPRGGNFYAFPRALSVEHARLARVARVRTAFRRGGSALLTRFFLSQNVPHVTIPSRHPSSRRDGIRRKRKRARRRDSFRFRARRLRRERRSPRATRNAFRRVRRKIAFYSESRVRLLSYAPSRARSRNKQSPIKARVFRRRSSVVVAFLHTKVTKRGRRLEARQIRPARRGRDAREAARAVRAA